MPGRGNTFAFQSNRMVPLPGGHGNREYPTPPLYPATTSAALCSRPKPHHPNGSHGSVKAHLLLGGFVLALGLLLLAGTAAATYYAAPDTYAIETVAIVPTNATHQQVFTTQTWHLSPDDPDQVNGALDYELWNEATGFYASANYQPVPFRPGWVHNTSSVYVAKNNTHLDRAVTVLQPSVGLNASCSVRHNFGDIGFPLAESWCGSSLPARPLGIGVRTINQANSTGLMNISVRITMPGDDNNTAYDEAANGSTYLRSYAIYLGGPNSTGVCPATGFCFTGSYLQRPYQVSAVNDRTFDSNISVGGAAPNELLPIQVRVFANDSRLRIHMEASCILNAAVGAVGDGYSCGNVTAFSDTLAPNIPGNVTVIPFVDAPGIAQAMGMTVQQVGWLWTILICLTFAVLGMVKAGLPGAGIGGSFGFAIAATLGMVPLWSIVIIFLAALSIIVWKANMEG